VGGGVPKGFVLEERLAHSFKRIISVENLLLAWQEFVRGKRNKRDVQMFQFHLMDNVLILHEELKNKTYHHGGYHHFRISDPKPRDIHKASVKDRLVHHAIYRVLYPYFHLRFIADSYSCQKGKGTHRAIARFREFSYQISKNNTRTGWVLKCDTKKFFASINHQILFSILEQQIQDADTLRLLKNIVSSFQTPGKLQTGLPLGNLTSQLLVNIYMNEFDQFVKHRFKVKHYIRYADDFVFLSEDREVLEALIFPVAQELRDRLSLELHPNKLFIKTIASGVDFLGWVHFVDHRVLRTATKRRMLRKLAGPSNEAMISSYLGMLSHGNTEKLRGLLSGI